MGLFRFCVEVAIEVCDWQFEVIGGLLVAASGFAVCCANSSFNDGFPRCWITWSYCWSLRRGEALTGMDFGTWQWIVAVLCFFGCRAPTVDCS